MTTLSTADARARFSQLVESASSTHERFEVTRNGARAAVILGAADYDSLIETIEVLSDPEAVRVVRDALTDLDSGAGVSGDEMRERMRAAGRLKR